MPRKSPSSAIFFEFHPCEEHTIPIGGSKLGGCPDLPKSIRWPCNKKKPLNFLCQINLGELQRLNAHGLLPEEGVLWFFFDEWCWGYEPKHKSGWKVLFCQAPSGLTRREKREPRYEAAAISFARKRKKSRFRGWQRPHAEIVRDYYIGYLLGQQGVAYQLDDPQVCSQLVSHGYNLGNWNSEEGFPDARAEELAKHADEWQYLLQFDDTASALFFLIRKEQLKARDFEDVWFQLQTT